MIKHLADWLSPTHSLASTWVHIKPRRQVIRRSANQFDDMVSTLQPQQGWDFDEPSALAAEGDTLCVAMARCVAACLVGLVFGTVPWCRQPCRYVSTAMASLYSFAAKSWTEIATTRNQKKRFVLNAFGRLDAVTQRRGAPIDSVNVETLSQVPGTQSMPFQALASLCHFRPWPVNAISGPGQSVSFQAMASRCAAMTWHRRAANQYMEPTANHFGFGRISALGSPFTFSLAPGLLSSFWDSLLCQQAPARRRLGQLVCTQ